MQVDITIKEFNYVIDVLKKIKRFSESFLVIGDVIKIIDKPSKILGQHYFHNDFIPIDGFVCYKCTGLSEIVTQLTEIKGKKTNLSIIVTSNDISITANDSKITLCELNEEEDDVIMFDQVDFDDMADCPEHWIGMSNADIEKIRSNECLTIIDGSHVVRIAKSIFPEIGTARSIKFKMHYRFTSVDTCDAYLFNVYVKYDRLQILHKFTCVNYLE